ncbi:hypothetical protein ACLOJK_040644 [Asimina triloba]
MWISSPKTRFAGRNAHREEIEAEADGHKRGGRETTRYDGRGGRRLEEMGVEGRQETGDEGNGEMALPRWTK